jgi:nucleoside-diphosphate-sugar epimerase
MVELAKVVAQEHGKSCSIKIMMEPIPGKPVVRYVPDTQRARNELGLTQHIALEEAIRKMFKSYAKYK